MSDFDLPYKTKFEIKAKVLNPSSDILHEAKASISKLEGVFPRDIDPESDPDLLYLVGNLMVAGVLNLNDDGLSLEETLTVYKKFEKKQANLEHNRENIVGFIVKAGLSEFGTDRPITDEEALMGNKPFNVAVVIALWKVAAKDLCNLLVEKSGNDGNQELSLSFEVGFDKYQIIELSGDSTDFSTAKKIIYQNSPEFNAYDAVLKINDGSGKKNGNRIGRSLCGRVLPLGAGIVTMPAAAVKGLLPITSKIENNKENPEIEANNFAVPSTHPYIAPSSIMKYIKLSASKQKEFEAKYSNLQDNKNLTVTLKSGKKVKLANYDKGYLEVPSDETFEDADIVTLETNQTADNTLVDNSKVVHPRLGQEFPNVNEETQKKDAMFEKQRAELRNKDYKDASGALLNLINRLQAAAERYFEQNPGKISVLKTNTNSKNIFSHNMDLSKLNEVKATVEKSTDVSALKEAFANTVLFAEELAKKSEEMEAATANHKKDMEAAKKSKDEAESMHAAVKKEMEALKTKVHEMEAAHKASEMESKFNARMSKLEATYDMDEGCRAFIASDIKAMDDEQYASYEQKLEALMKEKSKTYKESVEAAKTKAAIESHKDSDPHTSTKTNHGLAEAKKEKDEMEAKKKMEDDAKKKKEAEARFAEALASAKENPVDPVFVQEPADILSLKEKMKIAFGKDIKIGGSTVSELEDQRAKRLAE